jgi:hypothetical protein
MELNAELLAAFEREHGRMPSTAELFMLREASASVALDKGDGETQSLPEGAYTMTPAQVEERRANHEFCGRLNCPRHGERARYEHALRVEGMRLAIELINEHNRTGGNMHPADEFGEGLETAARVVELAITDPLFQPPNYDEGNGIATLLRMTDETTSGGEDD